MHSQFFKSLITYKFVYQSLWKQDIDLLDEIQEKIYLLDVLQGA